MAEETKYTPSEEIARMGWSFRPGLGEQFSNDTIQTSALLTLVKRLDTLVMLQRSTLDAMMSLGRDGLHDVIKEHARKVRAEKKRRLSKRRKARAKAKAVSP